MNAISSGINKGAVKVAPKASGSRRSRQQHNKAVIKIGTLVETQKESSEHLSADSATHIIDNFDSTKSATSRAIPIVGRSIASKRIDLSRSRHNHGETSKDIRQSRTGPPLELMPGGNEVGVGSDHGYTSVEFQDTPRSTQADTIMPSDTVNIDVTMIRSGSTTPITNQTINSPVPDHTQFANFIDKSNKSEPTPPAIGEAQARTSFTNGNRSTNLDEQLLQVDARSYKRSRRNGNPRGKMRESTPENAEFEIIDVSDVRMLDLCKDLRKGRKSSKYAQFKSLAAQRKQRRLLGMTAVQANPITTIDSVVTSNNESNGNGTLQEFKSDPNHGGHEMKNTSDPEDDDIEVEVEHQVYLQDITSSAPQVRIVDGKIVLDVGSLQVDRTARDAAGSSAVEYVEEDPLEKTVNSRSYSKHKLTPRWDALGTDLFYTGLSQWGTDFDMISRMFPTRTRKQIKNKFTIEEKRNPTLVTRALRKKEPVDMQEYSRISEIDFRSVAQLEQDLDELKTRFAVEREEAILDAQQRKIEALTGVSELRPVDEPRKKRHRVHDDGIEVVGNIEEVEEEERRAAARAAASSEGEDEE